MNQRLYETPDIACGPASAINFLRFGTPPMRAAEAGLMGTDDGERLRYVIHRYFLGRKSVDVPGAKRLEFGGVTVNDLTAAIAEVFADHHLGTVRGRFLDRRLREKDGEFVHRVHGLLKDSLEQGRPVLVSLRSFVASYHEDHEKILWDRGEHHYMVVTGVPAVLGEGERGFTFEFIDSDGAERRSGFVHAESRQPFSAFKGSTEEGEWLNGSPFLLVTAPTVGAVRPRDLEWSDRWLITLNYAICAQPAQP